VEVLDGGWEEGRRQKIAAAAARRRRRMVWAMAVVVAGLAAAAGAWAYTASVREPGTAPRHPVGAVSPYNATAVSVDLASAGATATFYGFETSGRAIRFFAVLGSDGGVRTAFDNAYCCFRRDLGERQEGADMVCNWCGKHFPIDELNRTNLDPLTVGRCCPAHLRNTVVGGKVVIEMADLEAGAYLFTK
jgi:uncharacterized membrane protein